MQGLMKLTVIRNGQYVLVTKPDGSHYEKFFKNQQEFGEAGLEASQGTLDNHVPYLGQKYSGRPYFN